MAPAASSAAATPSTAARRRPGRSAIGPAIASQRRLPSASPLTTSSGRGGGRQAGSARRARTPDVQPREPPDPPRPILPTSGTVVGTYPTRRRTIMPPRPPPSRSRRSRPAGRSWPAGSGGRRRCRGSGRRAPWSRCRPSSPSGRAPATARPPRRRRPWPGPTTRRGRGTPARTARCAAVSASAVISATSSAVSTGAPPSAIAVKKRRTSGAVDTSPELSSSNGGGTAKVPSGGSSTVEPVGAGQVGGGQPVGVDGLEAASTSCPAAR